MSTEPTWTDDWLTAKDARAIRAEEAERALYVDPARNRTIERAQTRQREIDAAVAEMVTEAENFGILLLVWAVVVLFSVAAVMALIHAFGIVFGLTALTVVALITYLVKNGD